MLRKLLQNLQDQETNGLFTYSAVIVDNDANKTAAATIENFKKVSNFSIKYFCEPIQNIALARNKAVENAKGDYIAFLDDDEFPISTWLLNLYKTITLYKSDGVLGPVKPYFPENCPSWLIKSKICERPEYKTGYDLHWGKTRTGNVLLNSKIFTTLKNPFGVEYGREGGEDIEFFKKMVKSGKKFIWCNEAIAFETVPEERWGINFYLKKELRIGGVVGDKIRKHEPLWKCIKSFLERTGLTIAMSIIIPFTLLFGMNFFIKVLIKILYNVGFISGIMGFVILRYRDD
jgi:glycosyltransferase involved in cell wall biosynthesis